MSVAETRADARDDGPWRSLRERAADELRATPLFRSMLRGPAPQHLLAFVRDLRAGDQGRGADLHDGLWRLGAEDIAFDKALGPFANQNASRHVQTRAHRFLWLADIVSFGQAGRARAKEWMAHWLQGQAHWRSPAWQPDVAADRVFAWLSAGRFLFEDREFSGRASLLDSLGRHARLIVNSWSEISDPRGRARAAVALVVCAAAIQDGPVKIGVALDILAAECAAQIGPDGCHLSRSPSLHAHLLFDLVAVDELLARRGIEPPANLVDAIAKMAPMLRLMRMPDGALAPFHGGGLGDPRAIAKLFEMVDPPSRRFLYTQSGYHRVETATYTLLVDAGAAPPPAFGGRAHAGFLAFEMLSGQDRLITNPADSDDLPYPERQALRVAAMHSTLTLRDEGAGGLVQSGLGGAAPHPIGPEGASVRRSENANAIVLEAQHSAWRARHGLIHRRTIVAPADGRALIGEDSLLRPSGETVAAPAKHVPFEIRFFLAPTVSISLSAQGKTAQLTTFNQDVWRLRASEPFAIEDVTLNQYRLGERGKCILLRGVADAYASGLEPPNRVNWRFEKLNA
ncbi:MAG TPA: hypothetical protein DCZ49_07615 [Hyphomonadaceae bacterium]|nr:hypothetical protein [Hyphomonadaceae bacterium]